MGFVPLSPTGAELLLEVFSQGYERDSILVTTNLPFDEWKVARVGGALTIQPGTLAVPLAHNTAAAMRSPPSGAEDTSVIRLSLVLARLSAPPRSR